jgi:ABC-type multidrug transport system fused ATPase/permease subunit
MSRLQTLPVLLKRIWTHLTGRRKRQFVYLLGLILMVALAEIINVGSVMPFIGIIVAPEQVFNSSLAKPIITFFGITSPNQLLLPIAVGFGLITIMTNGLRLLLLWASTKLSLAVGADLSLLAYRKSLFQPYLSHISRNSTLVTGGIGKISAIVSAANLTFTLIGSVIILLAILIALLFVNPIIALICFGGFGFLYGIIILVTRKELKQSSIQISEKASLVDKSLQEGLGGIRDIILDGTQDIYCKIFGDADYQSRKSQLKVTVISGSPRFMMEALSICILLYVAYLLSLRTDGILGILPILGAIGLGAQRLLPVLQAAYGSWSAMQGSRASLQDSLELLDQAMPLLPSIHAAEKIPFKNEITLENVAFQYGMNLPIVLSNVNLTIQKGSRVGIIGKTGEGKSTLLDVLMGLLLPTNGQIKIDGVSLNSQNFRQWQRHISHVPQSIYLADISVLENIAFGVPKHLIDVRRAKHAAQRAQISEVIDALEYGYDTLIGERGVKLSGGQKQRLGIARALYKDADVIIFDEATSALDTETESAVMNEINGLERDMTLIIIAHRKSTLDKCDAIIELESGMIKRVTKSSSI